MRLFLLTFFCLSMLFATTELLAVSHEAEKAQLNPLRAIVTAQDRFSGKKGVMLKQGLALETDVNEETIPDLTFEIHMPEAGACRVQMTVGLDPEESKRILSKATSKFDSFYTHVRINGGTWRTYVLFAPWNNPIATKTPFGLHDLPKGKSTIEIVLPEKVQADYLELIPWKPVAIPEKARNWKPEIVPPNEHPRVWVRAEHLQKVKANLDTDENRPVWEAIKKEALNKPRKLLSYSIDNQKAMSSLTHYVRNLEHKAFYYLMTNDEKIGRQVVDEMLVFLDKVQFGNVLDITRERGSAIYAASLVYDWCYPLLTEKEKRTTEKNLLRLAREMEISWPPFKQYIVNGHGNEGQLLRNLLTMAIAIYDADPEPYRLCAYRIFEELIPMRTFEYQSSRHNQGISYATARVVWDLTAASLLERMSGKRVFDDNITNVADYFLQMQLPTGEMFNDGDRWGVNTFRYQSTALMMYTYGKNPVMKAEYFRQNGGKPEWNSTLFLLLNDPQMKADPSFKTVPTGFDAGPIFPSQILRTGWMKDEWFTRPLSSDPDNNEVVVELRGGNFNSGNHQHADAGAFQIWYRGKQACDLGVYGFYGTTYDMNFNKGSSAHNLVFVYDPDEKFPDRLVNDAGQRRIRTTPLSPKDYLENPLFQTGKLIQSQIEPSPFHPLRSEFTLDLTPAYSDKVQSYIRSFRWLNLKRHDVPVVLIVYDKVTTRRGNNAKPLTTFWQINTLSPPQMTDDGFI
ncbi:MAG: heparinase II/III family protein, partial [Thermoguttaceae bacterium]|nr:heparinase II/III family protein [Thermoguttaceae bacterium]